MKIRPQSILKSISVAIAISFFSNFLVAAPNGWLQDFDLAKEKAKQQKKNLFVFFTGSDWCGLCQQLEHNILTQKEFQNAIKNDYIFVYVDSPRNKKRIPAKNQIENPKLFKKYAIPGTPTVLLMTSDGSVFGRTGYSKQSPKEYAKGIQLQTKASIIPNLRISIQKMPKGEARARAIDAVLSKNIELQETALDLIKEIYDADPNGQLGFRKKYFEVMELRPILYKIAKISQSFTIINIQAKNKSAEEKKQMVSEAREKNKEELLTIKNTILELKKIAPQSCEKTITNLLKGIDYMLGEDPI